MTVRQRTMENAILTGLMENGATRGVMGPHLDPRKLGHPTEQIGSTLPAAELAVG